MPTSGPVPPRPSRRRLPAEAQPITHLTAHEARQLEEADDWLREIIDVAHEERQFDVDKIKRRRTGRVFFISGPRGSGKTSLLLTLLARWSERTCPPPIDGSIDVFLPVLDFDPLPSDMPIEAWLLEPWRRKAKDLDKACSQSGDLTERFCELFDRVISGWTADPGAGKGLVEKAIAFQDKTSGWLDTQRLWKEFVDAMLCASTGRAHQTCKDEHRKVFVVPIDDVDLQVERIPNLLHALRLLHHPNVMYILTGDIEHLQDVIELDYLRRHHSVGGPGARAEEQRARVRDHSRELARAIVEKMLPEHALLELGYLSWNDLNVGNGHAGIHSVLDADVHRRIPEGARSLNFVLARQAAHAWDRFGSPTTVQGERRSLEYLAHLCGTELEDTDEEPDASTANYRFALTGTLSTQLGLMGRRIVGDRLEIILAKSTVFDFRPDFDEDLVLLGEEAHGAAFMRLLAEDETGAEIKEAAPYLEWAPNAGILATRVDWDLGRRSTAVFHWPWPIKPSARQVMNFGRLSEEMLKALDEGNSQRDVTWKFVSRWIEETVAWCESRFATVPGDGVPDPKPLRQRLGALHNLRDARLDMATFLRQLRVMAEPYFGLPDQTANELLELTRDEWWEQDSSKKGKALLREREETISNAIIEGDQLREGDQDWDPSEVEMEERVASFLRERRLRFGDQAPERWIPELPPAPGGSTSGESEG